jgi:hypothetical protein
MVTTPTRTKEFTQWIVKGEEFWDLGECLEINEREVGDYVAYFHNKSMIIKDVKRIVYHE